MQLRRKYIVESKGDRTFQKCLALMLVLKSRLQTSRIPHYSLNKLCRASGISHKTAERYEKWLIDYGFIHFEGTQENRVLVLNKISSHTQNRNIRISDMDFSIFFTAFRSLQSFIFMKLQYNKDYMRHLLQARHNPESPKQLGSAKRKVKNLVRDGKLYSVNAHYKEYGLSLERIAKEIGCCIRTVQRVIDFAEDYGWVAHQRNFEWFYAPHVNHRKIDGFTFSTNHKLCIAHPNTYTLAPSIFQSLAVGMVCI